MLLCYPDKNISRSAGSFKYFFGVLRGNIHNYVDNEENFTARLCYWLA